jgi:chromosome segregation ATPase
MLFHTARPPKTDAQAKARAAEIERTRKKVNQLNRTIAEAQEARAKIRTAYAVACKLLADLHADFREMTEEEKTAHPWAKHWERADRNALAYHMTATIRELTEGQ